MARAPGNGAERSARRKASPYPRVELVPRLLARTADLLVAALFAWLVPSVGPLLGVVYLLLADGLPGGQSPGKRLLGIKTVHVPTRRPCSPRLSVIRNLPVGLAFALALNVFLAFVAVPILLVEAYLSARDELGMRTGDVLADTQVIDAKVPFATGELDLGRSRRSIPLPPSEVGDAEGART